MPYIYNGYCYATSAEVVNIANSYGPQFLDTAYLQGSTLQPVHIRFSSVDLNNVPRIFESICERNANTGQFTCSQQANPIFSYPSCTTVGPVQLSSPSTVTVNQTLQTPASLDSPPPSDVITGSWMVVSALVGAWSIKQMRKSL